MNTASRLEGANKAFDTRLLVSETVRERLSEVTANRLGWIGRIALKGKDEPIEVYTSIEPGHEECFELLREALSALDSRNVKEAEGILVRATERWEGFSAAKFSLDQLRQNGTPLYDVRSKAYWVLSSK